MVLSAADKNQAIFEVPFPHPRKLSSPRCGS
jgi:hypothetical protein